MRIIPLSEDSIERTVHLLTDDEEWAIKAAVAANRPLLVRGEPGIGKTQLALAAAKDLNRPIVGITVDARTESRDLLWTFDAVQRLAEAQVLSNIYQTENDLEKLKGEINVRKFVRPGPVWFGIDWDSAVKQLGDGQEAPSLPDDPWQPTDGVVVLIDEIDKADRDLPNGLLEAFGMRQFLPQGYDAPVKMKPQTAPPLVIVTTNEERVLPDPFLRRCFVLNMDLPDVTESDTKDDFLKYLVDRGEAHFPKAKTQLLNDAAELLYDDRLKAIQNQLAPYPGVAEYLDFLRAILTLTKRGDMPEEAFEKIRRFAFHKAREDKS